MSILTIIVITALVSSTAGVVLSGQTVEGGGMISMIVTWLLLVGYIAVVFLHG